MTEELSNHIIKLVLYNYGDEKDNFREMVSQALDENNLDDLPSLVQSHIFTSIAYVKKQLETT